MSVNCPFLCVIQQKSCLATKLLKAPSPFGTETPIIWSVFIVSKLNRRRSALLHLSVPGITMQTAHHFTQLAECSRCCKCCSPIKNVNLETRKEFQKHVQNCWSTWVKIRARNLCLVPCFARCVLSRKQLADTRMQWNLSGTVSTLSLENYKIFGRLNRMKDAGCGFTARNRTNVAVLTQWKCNYI